MLAKSLHHCKNYRVSVLYFVYFSFNEKWNLLLRDQTSIKNYFNFLKVISFLLILIWMYSLFLNLICSIFSTKQFSFSVLALFIYLYALECYLSICWCFVLNQAHKLLFLFIVAPLHCPFLHLSKHVLVDMFLTWGFSEHDANFAFGSANLSTAELVARNDHQTQVLTITLKQSNYFIIRQISSINFNFNKYKKTNWRVTK